nr:hypothetical protein [Streptomyces sp. LUP47B]
MSRPRGQEGEQCPGVVERRLIRMVLNGQKVKAETVDEQCLLAGAADAEGSWVYVGAETGQGEALKVS